MCCCGGNIQLFVPKSYFEHSPRIRLIQSPASTIRTLSFCSPKVQRFLPNDVFLTKRREEGQYHAYTVSAAADLPQDRSLTEWHQEQPSFIFIYFVDLNWLNNFNTGQYECNKYILYLKAAVDSIPKGQESKWS